MGSSGLGLHLFGISSSPAGIDIEVLPLLPDQHHNYFDTP